MDLVGEMRWNWAVLHARRIAADDYENVHNQDPDVKLFHKTLHFSSVVLWLHNTRQTYAILTVRRITVSTTVIGEGELMVGLDRAKPPSLTALISLYRVAKINLIYCGQVWWIFLYTFAMQNHFGNGTTINLFGTLCTPPALSENAHYYPIFN